MKGYNKVILGGNVTADPESRFTGAGVQFTNFTLAVSRDFNKDEVDFIKCTAWRKAAEIINDHVVKGTSLLVEGKLRIEQVKSEDGTTRYFTKVEVDTVRFTGSKQSEPEA